jgi:hypothetical protein
MISSALGVAVCTARILIERLKTPLGGGKTKK